MPKEAKSQWEFDDLMAAATRRRVMTVGQLTASIRQLLETQIGEIWVIGEVTNLRVQTSGHIYFTLKDAAAQLSCVLFRSELVAHRELLEDGQKLVLQGGLTVYESRGQYQLIVRAIELQGQGALQIAFERLKQKLQAEGLFAAERKRPIPRYPQRIGLVTSPTGAAIRDVLHAIRRRYPGLRIVLGACRVQGSGAANEIACAIRLLNDWSQSLPRDQRLDLILLTRGGGSLEDLWAFNEEAVARAIFESGLPVVSAVGHEIDFTISDFVADLRAATPSAGAELITEGAVVSRGRVADLKQYVHELVRNHLAERRADIQLRVERLARLHPRRQLNEKLQHLDDLSSSLSRCLKQGYRHSFVRWQNLQQRLGRLRPSLLMAERKQVLLELFRRLQEHARHRLIEATQKLRLFASRLGLLSPENVLARGYSITADAQSGKILRAAGDAVPGQRLKTRLASGKVFSRVEDRPKN